MKINKKFLIVFLILLALEIFIGLFVNDAFIRPFVGDILVVILIYTFIRAIIQKPIKFLPLYIFVFALMVEMAQYFRIVNLLKLQDNKFFSTIIGTTYDIRDILCYLVGTIILLIWEWKPILKK